MQAVRSGICMIVTIGMIKVGRISPVFGHRENYIPLFFRGFMGATSMAVYYFAIMLLPLADVVSPSRKGQRFVLEHCHSKWYTCFILELNCWGGMCFSRLSAFLTPLRVQSCAEIIQKLASPLMKHKGWHIRDREDLTELVYCQITNLNRLHSQ